MGKIFGISDLPVAKPFPSLEFGRTEISSPVKYLREATSGFDTYVKKNIPKKRFLKQFFSRIKH